MPAAAFAVSGHARAVSSWLNLVERLGVGADDQVAAAWHPSQRPGAGGSIRDWVELCGAVTGQANRDPRRNAGGLRHVFPSEDIGRSQPAAEVSALVSEGAVGALR